MSPREYGRWTYQSVWIYYSPAQEWNLDSKNIFLVSHALHSTSAFNMVSSNKEVPNRIYPSRYMHTPQ